MIFPVKPQKATRNYLVFAVRLKTFEWYLNELYLFSLSAQVFKSKTLVLN